MRRFWARLAALFRSNRLDRELQDEVAAHLELAERDALRRGLDPLAARHDALRQFGGIDQMRETHRDSRSVRWMEHLVKDARYGAASLLREPGFALVAIGVLALGIGANTAMFSLVDAVLLKPLPFPNPERIVRIWETPTPTTRNSTTTRTFEELLARNQSFEAVSAESLSTATLMINGEPTRLNGRYVSAGHFAVFGIQPMLGRAFLANEDREGGEKVVILSHAAWQTHFGGDAAIIGRTVPLDNESHRIIGVLPAGAFDRHRARPLQEPAAFWRLNAFTADERNGSAHWLNPLARLKPGVSIAQARAEVQSIRVQIADTIPAWKQSWGLDIEPFDAQLVSGTLRQSIYLALGAVVLVLVIACANIANLLLARSAARQKEIAVRVALGASRGRVAAQLLTETLVLTIAGTLCGLGVAAAVTRATVPLIPELPFTADVVISWRVLAFSAATALAVSVLVGVFPAFRLSRGSAAAALNRTGRGMTGSSDRFRRSLVTAEVALSVVLLCCAFLLFKSLARLQSVDIGARVDRILTMSIDLPWSRYPDGHHWARFYPQLIERVRTIAGVDAAAISGDVPLEGTGGENLRLPGRDERLLVRFKRADADYFSTLGIPVRAGRGFTAQDRIGTPYVVVINEALAARLRETFNIAQPLGAEVDLPLLGFGRDRRGTMTIVGVIGNERVQRDLRVAADPIAYVPIAQAPRMQIKLAVRTLGEPLTVLPAIRAVMRQLDPQLALADVRTMEQIRDGSLANLRQPVWLIGAFALLSVLLAALGLYGVVAHAVTQQRREIGIRMALGAQTGDVLSMVVRHTTTTIAAGLIVGLAGGYAVTGVTRSLLFEVSPLDPFAFAVAAAVMISVALLAAVVPASRATRVDPTTALRSE
jgi:predicted permease